MGEKRSQLERSDSMNKNNQNMEALSQQIKHNNRWRRVGLIVVLGVFITGAVIGFVHYLGSIVGIIVSAVALVAKWLTTPAAKAAFAVLMLVINSTILLFCSCANIKMVKERSEFFNETAVKWGREWLLESHDFRNDGVAHLIFYKAALTFPVLEIIATTIVFSEVSYFAKLILFIGANSSNIDGIPLTFANRAIAISFGLAILIKLGATIWHCFFQYRLKEYPQAFIDKVKHNHDVYGKPYDVLEPVINSVWSSPVPLTVVWSILQMPPKRSENDN